MIKRTLEQIARMAGGALAGGRGGETAVHGVSTDTRTLAPGNLFVPLAGDNFEGHDYIQAAVERGASAALWERRRPRPDVGIPLVLVNDTLSALQQLAGEYRDELPVRIVGITGSNGKTTTKDMTAATLSPVFKVHKTKGNLNNHIGLPLTLLQLDETTEAAVIEMGMSGRGEIALLTALARPDVAIVTNIGESHLLQLGSREEIARAKTEILAGLQDDGLFIYNGDEPLIESVLPEMPQPESMRTLRFGTENGNDLFPVSVQLETAGTRFKSNLPESPEFYIPLLGRHNVVNALAAIAAARHLGVPYAKAAEGLSSLKMSGMRIERVVAPSGAVILNDAYNASPTSMKAALSLLQEIEGFSRKIAVLGDMLELGDGEADFHAKMGRLAAAAGIDLLYAFGPLSRHMADAAKASMPEGSVRWYEDKPALLCDLAAEVHAGDVVLVKASRGTRLEEAVQMLQGS